MSRLTLASEVVAPALRSATRDTRAAMVRVANAPNDQDAVHDFRVGIRRIRSVLRAGAGLYRRRPLERIGQQLRAVAQATNALRDEEVLAETLALVELGQAERAAANAWLAHRGPELVALRSVGLELLATSSLGKSLDALLAILDAPPKHDVPAVEFAQTRMVAARIALAERLPTVNVGDAESLHTLRIRFKRLRYVADMLASGLGRKRSPRAASVSAACSETARLAATFQKELGVIHDIDVARATLQSAAELEATVRASLDAALSVRRGELAKAVVERLQRELATLVMPDALGG
jgi:CHAD domain-containing protein